MKRQIDPIDAASMPTRLTDAQRALILRRLPIGLFDNDSIAKEAQCSLRTVQRHRARWEVTGQAVATGKPSGSGNYRLLPIHSEAYIVVNFSISVTGAPTES